MRTLCRMLESVASIAGGITRLLPNQSCAPGWLLPARPMHAPLPGSEACAIF